MKKLGKRIVTIKETIEAYACSCASCSCDSGCGCSCSFLLGAPKSDSYGKAFTGASDWDNNSDAYSSNYSK